MAAETWEFNGEQMTASQIKKIVPIYSEKTIRDYARAGAKNPMDMARMEVAGRGKTMSAIRKTAKSGKGWAANRQFIEPMYSKKKETKIALPERH